jgi:cobalt-zinc-cadmium efflux system membrane fusion protein
MADTPPETHPLFFCIGTPVKHIGFYALTASLLSLMPLLTACTEAPAQKLDIAAPILQGRQLRFAPDNPQLALLGVFTATASKTLSVELPARLVWNEAQTQRIYPAFAGRVTTIQADVGQSVQPGRVLAQLASPDFGMAQADTAKAQSDVRLMHKTLLRQRELFDAGIIARKDLDQAEADETRAQAESQRAAARTRLYGGGGTAVNQQLALQAGIHGVVVERNLNPGQELRPDQSGPGMPAVFVVTDPTSLWVQIDARELDAGTLRPGSVFDLVIPSLPGQKFEGRVLASADYIDPVTRTIKVRGVVANPQRLLKAEMLATARIERVMGSGVLIPAQAVSLQGALHTVMVQLQPGVFESREVTLSYQGPREVVVSSGLEVGEKVVSDNTLLLSTLLRSAQEEARPGDAAKVSPLAQAAR